MSPDPTASPGASVLLLDLGDLFTKGLLLAPPAPPLRLRFPSVVAHELLGSAPSGGDELLLGATDELPRPAGFAAARARRTRSYPGGEGFLRRARGVTPPGRVTLAGWLAAAFGADRVALGQRPSPDVLEALTHKALLVARVPPGPVRLGFVVDGGVKAQITTAFAGEIGGALELAAASFGAPRPRRLRFTLATEILDAPACAAAALPFALPTATTGGVLLVDVGYQRTKLAVIAHEGCALQREHDGLGIADCVRRVLRDAQDQGLAEDELAVASALESAPRTISIAGRTYATGAIVDRAVADLADAVARAAQQALADDFGRRGTPCRIAALLGGGAALAGRAIAARLRAAGVGLERVWQTPDPSHHLLHGAGRLRRGEA